MYFGVAQRSRVFRRMILPLRQRDYDSLVSILSSVIGPTLLLHRLPIPALFQLGVPVYEFIYTCGLYCIYIHIFCWSKRQHPRSLLPHRKLLRQTMCLLNGELIIFGGSDETPNMNATHPTSREVDAYVYHVRPRLRNIPLPVGHPNATPARAAAKATASGGRGRGDTMLTHWHERAMAREVNTLAGLVLAAEERRERAAQREASAAASAGLEPAPVRLSATSRFLQAEAQCSGRGGEIQAATGASAQRQGAATGAGPSLTPGQEGQGAAAAIPQVRVHGEAAQVSTGAAWGQAPNSPTQMQPGVAARSQAGRLAGFWDSVPANRNAFGPRPARKSPSRGGRAYGVKVSRHVVFFLSLGLVRWKSGVVCRCSGQGKDFTLTS